MNLKYIRRLEKIEERLAAATPAHPDAVWMIKTFNSDRDITPDFALPVTQPGRDMLTRGGKRWRPLLATLICEALGGGDAALPLIPLVELPHNASLIHDDIEDNSNERRGKPAIHLLYGEDAAINGGCFLYFLPLVVLENWRGDGDLKNHIYALWGEHMRRLHLGQGMDIHWHRNFRLFPSEGEYLEMCRLKTGCLARFAAILGVYTGFSASWDASKKNFPKAAKALGEGAEKLGVGFQILDDVRNLTTGNPGKRRGDDIVEGKKSLPILLFLKRRPESLAMIERIFTAARAKGTNAPEVEELILEMEAQGVLTEAQERGVAFVAEGLEEIRGYFSREAPDGIKEFPGTQEARELLFEFASFIG